MKLADKIKELLSQDIASGLTCDEIGRKIGTKGGTVWSWLHHDKEPKRENIVKLARAYNVPMYYFYPEENFKIAEDTGSYKPSDDIDIKIINNLRGMTRSDKLAILEYIEDQKLLKEIKKVKANEQNRPKH